MYDDFHYKPILYIHKVNIYMQKIITIFPTTKNSPNKKITDLSSFIFMSECF